jgi:hypothetical protein
MKTPREVNQGRKIGCGRKGTKEGKKEEVAL